MVAYMGTDHFQEEALIRIEGKTAIWAWDPCPASPRRRPGEAWPKEKRPWHFFCYLLPHILETAPETFVSKASCGQKPVKCEVPCLVTASFPISLSNCCSVLMLLILGRTLSAECYAGTAYSRVHSAGVTSAFCLISRGSDANAGRDGARVMPAMYFRWWGRHLSVLKEPPLPRPSRDCNIIRNVLCFTNFSSFWGPRRDWTVEWVIVLSEPHHPLSLATSTLFSLSLILSFLKCYGNGS